MIKIIDIDENGLSTKEFMDSLVGPGGAMVRRNGHIVARIEPADDDDLEEERWLQQPEQIERGRQAREEYREGKTIPHEEVCREFGIKPEAE